MNRSISQIHLTFNFVVAFITTAPGNISACSGTVVTLNWRYERGDDFKKVYWLRNDKIIMTMTKSGPAELAAGVTNIQHVSNGKIKITAISLADAGEYMLMVRYGLSSGLPTARDMAYVNVLGKLLYI